VSQFKSEITFLYTKGPVNLSFIFPQFQSTQIFSLYLLLMSRYSP